MIILCSTVKLGMSSLDGFELLKGLGAGTGKFFIWKSGRHDLVCHMETEAVHTVQQQ